MKKCLGILGSKELEANVRNIKEIDIEVEDNIETAIGLMEFMKFDITIVNSLLATESQLIDLANMSKNGNGKVIVLLKEKESYENKKLIASLVAHDIYSFISLEDLNGLENDIFNYPDKFDFNVIGEEKIIEVEKIVEKEKIITNTQVIKNKIVSIYSPDHADLTADLAAMLSEQYNKNSNFKVLVIDFNTTNPCMDKFLNLERESKVREVYTVGLCSSLRQIYSVYQLRHKLTYKDIEKYVIKDNVVSFLSGIYDLILEEKIEAEFYEEVINVASMIYDVVIVNTNPYLKSASTFMAITKATDIILTCKANILDIEHCLNTYKLLNTRIHEDKMKFVIYKGKYAIDTDLIEKKIKNINLIGVLDYKNEIITKSINEGIAIFDLYKKKDKLKYKNIIDKLGYIPRPRKRILFK